MGKNIKNTPAYFYMATGGSLAMQPGKETLKNIRLTSVWMLKKLCLYLNGFGEIARIILN
jgi:hypothetical protein